MVGKYLLVKTDTINKQFKEFTAKGEVLNTSLHNGKMYNNSTDYWYTSNNNTIHILYYSEDWATGSFESSFPYRLSALKDTLTFTGGSPMIRQ